MSDFSPLTAQVLLMLNNFLQIFGLSLTQTHLFWGAVQISVALSCFILAKYLASKVEPKLEERVRAMSLDGSRLRMMAVVLRRTRWVIFVLLLWLGISILRVSTWDSRSFLLTVIASLATSWVVISFASRMIKNQTLSRIVAVVGWVIVAFYTLGIMQQTVVVFDELAIEMSGFRISLLMIVQGVVLLSFLFWAALAISRMLERQFQTFEDISPTMRVLVGKISRFVLLTMAGIIGLSIIGIDFSALTLVSGAIGLGIGFGLQKVVSNLISGVILLLDKSIKPGDVISVGDTFGWITSLNARYVSVTARDGREYLIPNEDLITQQVENWSFNDTYIRIEINFGVSYNSDPHLVKEIAVKAALKHARTIRATGEYQTVCHIVGFGDSSIDFTLRFWIADPTNGTTNIRGDVFLALWDTFKENDIEIPFPHRHLLLDPATSAALNPQANGETKTS
ncbi:mechanosensitive ion channel family protein [Maritalea sp.]|uniref:mechanosensitive ion channel family protein n=1 Tax=Maritalea sp. TaxID=2003361 RepID=UPI003EF3C1B8